MTDDKTSESTIISILESENEALKKLISSLKEHIIKEGKELDFYKECKCCQCCKKN